MKVTQEKLPASQVGLEIEIPPELSKSAYEKVIQQFIRSANIPGFRKGKVPRHILLQRVGQRNLKSAALEDIMQDCIEKAIAQENIEAIGGFELAEGHFEELVNQFDPGQGLIFKATVDVVPEVKVSDYQGLSVKVEDISYDPEEVNKTLENYRSENATLIPVDDREAQSGDVALVDFQGHFAITSEGETPEEIPGGKAEDFQVELTEGQFIPGFTEGIVGMKIGETKEISAQFPEEYGNEELAGKAATFVVTLKELKGKELPELNDDFAQEISDFDTLAELRESLEKSYKEGLQEKLEYRKGEALIKELLKHLEVDLPATMINQEIDLLLTQQAMQLSKYGIDIRQLFNEETIPLMRERTRPDAISRLKQSLAIEEVAKREGITASEEEIQAEMRDVMKELGRDQDVDLDRLRVVVETDLVKEKTLKWLEEKGTVELVPPGTLTPPESEGSSDSDEESQEGS